MPYSRRLGPVFLLVAMVPLLALNVHTDSTSSHIAAPAAEPVDSVPAESALLTVSIDDAAFGKSGALRTRFVDSGATVPLPLQWDAAPEGMIRYRWQPVMGTPGDGGGGVLEAGGVARAPAMAGVYELELSDGRAAQAFGETLRLVVRVPFDRKRNGRIGPYFMGTWPTEGKDRRDAYAPPGGFIEVTEENRDLQVSENFAVGQFVTHDQQSVWPKYVALDPRLLDKLELVLQELRAMGVHADRMVVMSGFRTPQYNHRHLGNSPSSLSRHQFGDAADVWVENGDDRSMSDLNGDGRRDVGDARVILEAVDRVERRHPELVGGAGVYRANRVRGPFIHIDVRGARARW